MKQRIYIIAGPTASGKTAAAIGVAKRMNAEIVSADSIQIYRGLDIGSANHEIAIAGKMQCDPAEVAVRARHPKH